MKAMRILTIIGLGTLLALTPTSSPAQEGGQREGDRGGRGNFDPAEFQKQMLERTRERLEITDDAEWKAIEPLVTKVNEARMASMTTRGFGGRGGRGPGGPGGPSNPEVDQLQKVIDAKASNAETKAALDKFVAARKAKQAELEKAQANLRKVLTPRQEAIATLNGLL